MVANDWLERLITTWRLQSKNKNGKQQEATNNRQQVATRNTFNNKSNKPGLEKTAVPPPKTVDRI